MANVNFKRGLQSSIATHLADPNYTWDEGTFYLTTDTNRLYFAQSSTNLVNLNQYIRFWSGNSLPTVSTVPTLADGDIYYWEGYNILAIRDSNADGGWTQLNPDTALAANQTAIVGVASNGGTGLRISTSVRDTNNTVASGNFELVPGNSNVSITNSGNVITITTQDENDDTTYQIGTTQTTNNSNTATVTLTPTLHGTAGTVQSITISGDGDTHVESDASGNITISSTGGVGNIAQYFNTSGNLSTVVTAVDTTVISSRSVLPQITYGATGNTSTATFNGADNTATTGTAVLDVYTTSQVDTLISQALGNANALTYAGVLTGSNIDDVLVSTANAGEVWKVGEDISKNGTLVHPEDSTKNGTAHAGDLVISSGTDGNVTWEVVPSGDDQVISVDLPTTNNSVRILDNSILLGGFSINGDNAIIGVTPTVANDMKTYTISHAVPAANSGTAVTISQVVTSGAGATALAGATSAAVPTTIDIPVITGLSIDSYGHVVDATGQTYRITDTHGAIDSIGYGVTVSNNNDATITETITFDGDASNHGSFHIKTTANDSLQVSADGTSGVKLELVWGTF